MQQLIIICASLNLSVFNTQHCPLPDSFLPLSLLYSSILDALLNLHVDGIDKNLQSIIRLNSLLSPPPSPTPHSPLPLMIPQLLTVASLMSQESSHTVPHTPLYCTSTRPLLGVEPPTRRKGTWTEWKEKKMRDLMVIKGVHT